MTRGTTPTIIVTLPETVELRTAAHLYATVKQGSTLLRKEDEEIVLDGQSVSFALTQAETLALRASIDAEVQLNWCVCDEKRADLHSRRSAHSCQMVLNSAPQKKQHILPVFCR